MLFCFVSFSLCNKLLTIREKFRNKYTRKFKILQIMCKQKQKTNYN